MRVLITGSQGSGKTTQAELLAKHLGIPMIGMGDILREKVKEKTKEGKEINVSLESGQMVDDNIVADVVRARIKSKDCENGFIIDGYPRSLDQLRLFDNHLLLELQLYLINTKEA